MSPIIFYFPENLDLATIIAGKLGYATGEFEFRQFPDEETYLRINTEVKDHEVILVCSLEKPDRKILPLLFFAETAKSLEAKSVTLVAPYLAYMRQDIRFQPGEAVTSNYFAALLSQYFDTLITIDPHLHRHKSLNEIYTIPNKVLHATNTIATWIKDNIKQAVLIGPDSESEQWVKAIAKKSGAPYIILEKTRHGDKEVEVTHPQLEQYKIHIPVLIDDIISTARTMIATVTHLQSTALQAPVCIGVHAIFAEDAYELLVKSGVAQVITCNTVPHVSNQIDISELLITAIKEAVSD